MRNLVQFVTSLPGAMLLTGFIMERLGVLGIIEQLALAFQQVSADFWVFVFRFVPFTIDYDPNILSTYTLLIVPLLFELFRGGLDKEDDPSEKYYYWAGLFAVALIVTGYGAWSFIGGIYQAVGLMLLTMFTVSAIFLPISGLWYLFFGFSGMVVINQIVSLTILILMISFWWSDASLAEAVRALSWPEWLKNPLANALELYRWSTLGTFLFSIFTLIVLLMAPLTRAPLFVVSWVGVFFAANWFDAQVRPVIYRYLDELPGAGISG